MELSRRHFFRRLWSTGDRTQEERLARYAALESFARTQLLPYDFSLTDEQLSAMQAGVRFHLKATRDNELFAPEICVKLQKIVDAMIGALAAGTLPEAGSGIQTVPNRTAKPPCGHVAAFLNERATPAQIDALRARFGIQDLKALEARLETEIHSWVNGQTNEELLQYDREFDSRTRLCTAFVLVLDIPRFSWNLRKFKNIEKFSSTSAMKSCRLAPARVPSAEPGSKSGDWIDHSSMESDIHVRLALKQTDSKLLRAIEEAILRLDQGVYGICMECEEEIAPARLDAVPWTRVCINCKERQGKS